MTTSSFGSLFRSLRGGLRTHVLGGFLDSLLQGFENCRVGLSDETLRSGEGVAVPFFLDLYEKEIPRLEETVRLFETGLPEPVQRDILAKVDELVRKVVVPAYVRLARRFTLRERNDFYLLPNPLHGLERILWGVLGMGLGAFVVWAPFIPIWEKEWVLLFLVGGLLFPNARRYLALRRYQAELNTIVAHADDEIRRTEIAYLSSALPEAERASVPAPGASEAPASGGSERARLRQGGR